jgi:HD-GYP domain-containing protein (c-di-GMP phosphodiesterase class II)
MVVPQPWSEDSTAGTRTMASPTGRDPGAATRVTRGSGVVSAKTLELGRGFMSALFMGLRTAQIHDPQNQAFERAVNGVRVAADQLYAATGGFSISFVDESAFLNGVRLRFDGGMFDSMRTLRHILESKELGGIDLRAPPSYDAVRKLLLLFSTAEVKEEVSREDLIAAQIGVLGVQTFADQSRDGVKVDRRIFALQSYAKLLLAFREQQEKAMAGAHGTHAPRLRAVRVVQDLVELCGDRADFLLRLGSNHAGAPIDELHAVNTALLSISIGHALGLQRPDLVDIGVAGLFHDIGRSEGREAPLPVDAGIIGADAPIAYDGELKLADGWEPPMDGSPSADRPVPYTGELRLEHGPAERRARKGERTEGAELLAPEHLMPVEHHATPQDPSDVPQPALIGELVPPEDTEEAYFSLTEPNEFGMTTQASVAPSFDGIELPEDTAAGDDEPIELDPSALLSPAEGTAEDDALVIPVEALDLLSEGANSTEPTMPPVLDESALMPVEEPSPPIVPLGLDAELREIPGQPGHPEELISTTTHPHTAVSLVRLIAGGGIGRSSLTRAIVASEHHVLLGERYDWGDQRPRSHLFSRIVAVADAYDALTGGLGSEDGVPMMPLDALQYLASDPAGRVDLRLVDVLINILRAFPVGTLVVLDNGESAKVTSQAGGTRWDRPVVKTLTDPPRSVDLMLRDEGRFRARIIATFRALEKD